MKISPLLVEEETKNATQIGDKIRKEAGLDIAYLQQFADIKIRFVEIDGLVRVMLEIGEKATHKDIRDAIPNILRWRDELLEMQSDKVAYHLFSGMLQTPTSSKENLLEFLSQAQERGKSYAQLAELFNQVLGKTLVEIRKYQGKTITTEQLAHMKYLMQRANIMLSALNIKGVDTENTLVRIAAGKPPFQKGWPISRYKMIEALRTWRKGKPHGRVKNALKKVKTMQDKHKE